MRRFKKLTDDNLDDTQLCRFCSGPLPCLTHNEKPKTYRIVGIEKALAPSVYEREIWNAAIEAAAEYLEIIQGTDKGIRSLKKWV